VACITCAPNAVLRESKTWATPRRRSHARLLGEPAGREHTRARGERERHGVLADAAGAQVHQHAFARAHPRALAQRMQRGHGGDRQHRGLREREPLGMRATRVAGTVDVAREAAARERRDALAERETAHAGADRRDDAGAFAAQNPGQTPIFGTAGNRGQTTISEELCRVDGNGGLSPISSRPIFAERADLHQHVLEIEAGRGDADLDHSRAGRAALHRLERQRIDAALARGKAECVARDRVALGAAQAQHVPHAVAPGDVGLAIVERGLDGERARGVFGPGIEIDAAHGDVGMLERRGAYQSGGGGLGGIGLVPRAHALRALRRDDHPRRGADAASARRRAAPPRARRPRARRARSPCRAPRRTCGARRSPPGRRGVLHRARGSRRRRSRARRARASSPPRRAADSRGGARGRSRSTIRR
jgi:hypothetical protein